MADSDLLDVLELADALLRRLRLSASSGRVELEFRDGAVTKVFLHEGLSRSQLVARFECDDVIPRE